jgi:hypothetical protein
MYDLLMAVAFMSVVFGLAASILFIADRLTIRSKNSKEESASALRAREGRWLRRWGFLMFVMAAISLVVAALGGNKEGPLGGRVFEIMFAAAFVILYIRFR